MEKPSYCPSRNELQSFVDEEYDYYLEKWCQVDDPRTSSSWNWSSFCGSFFWMGYRKMYIELVIILAVLLPTIILLTWLGLSIGSFISLIIGLYGNALYYNSVSRKIKKIKEQYGPDANYDELLKKKGGTSPLGIGITILILIVYVIIAFFAVDWLKQNQ